MLHFPGIAGIINQTSANDTNGLMMLLLMLLVLFFVRCTAPDSNGDDARWAAHLSNRNRHRAQKHARSHAEMFCSLWWAYYQVKSQIISYIEHSIHTASTDIFHSWHRNTNSLSIFPPTQSKCVFPIACAKYTRSHLHAQFHAPQANDIDTEMDRRLAEKHARNTTHHVNDRRKIACRKYSPALANAFPLPSAVNNMCKVVRSPLTQFAWEPRRSTGARAQRRFQTGAKTARWMGKILHGVDATTSLHASIRMHYVGAIRTFRSFGERAREKDRTWGSSPLAALCGNWMRQKSTNTGGHQCKCHAFT